MRVAREKLVAAAALVVIVIAAVIVVLAGFPRVGPSAAGEPPLPGFLAGVPRSITISSPAFTEGSEIDAKYTCDGADVNPPLAISGVPGEARSLALVMYDPDAPRGWFTHWILYDAPPSLSQVPEGVPRAGVVEGLGLQGVNDFGGLGYGGPCPPPGETHRYVILVIALDVEKLGLPPGASYEELEDAVRGHVVAYGYTYFTYSRR